MSMFGKILAVFNVLAATLTTVLQPQFRPIVFDVDFASRCGRFAVPGIVEARSRLERDVPMVVRIVGTNAEEAKPILAEANLITADSLDDAAAIARRSGVVVELDGDAKRVFDVVVQPDKLPVNGNRDDEVARLRQEVSRSEGMLSNERFVANAPAEVVEGEREKLERYRRELDALGG